ncbi:MAG TPA: YXWGXW repeat-containing protein [Burkholderiaceae bacterium]|nr:YXWGXW repeat-containing protein [Burkholderiaceae bacterium]
MNLSNRRLATVLAASALALDLSGCVVTPPRVAVAAPAVVMTAPPPPQVEVIGAPPVAGYVWIGGYWNWVGERHVWVPGHWAEPRAGHVWVAHQWVREGPGWRMVPGHWERR